MFWDNLGGWGVYRKKLKESECVLGLFSTSVCCFSSHVHQMCIRQKQQSREVKWRSAMLCIMTKRMEKSWRSTAQSLSIKIKNNFNSLLLLEYKDSKQPARSWCLQMEEFSGQSCRLCREVFLRTSFPAGKPCSTKRWSWGKKHEFCFVMYSCGNWLTFKNCQQLSCYIDVWKRTHFQI